MKRFFAALIGIVLCSAALASDDPVRDTRQIMAGTVTTAKVKNEYLSGRRDNTTAFKGALAAYKAVRAAEKPPIPPAVPVYPVVAPGIGGELPIADRFVTAAALVPADSVPTEAHDPTGAFRFLCGAGHLGKHDPIVFPGQGGAGHLHQFLGNTATNPHSNYESLRTTGGTTCGDSEAPVQRSSYWIPAMLDGEGNAVKPDFMLTYYKALPASHPACGFPDAFPDPDGVTRGTHIGICTPLPNGLRFVFGYNMQTGKGGPTDASSPDYYAFAFECTTRNGDDLGKGRHRTIAAVVAAGCPLDVGYLRIAAIIPQCWDGKNLDVGDHRSHMAYASDGGAFGMRSCPKTHPYKIPEIAGSLFFKIDAAFLAGKWHFTMDKEMGLAAGTTMHMDYWEAWSPTIKAAWQANCIDRHLSCNNGNLGNGQQIKGMQTPPGGWPVGVKVPLASIPGMQ